MKLYAIRDSKAEVFLPMLEASTDDHAKRLVADAIAGGLHHMATHRDDYYLYALAEYDNNSGHIEAHRPEPVISISEIMETFFQRPEQSDLEEHLAPDPE